MSELIDKAIEFATKKHSGQYRKFSKIPYILHPLEVATIIASLTDDEEVIAAGLLHDVIEDCKVEIDEISKNFGNKVMALVASETEDKHLDIDPYASWEIRKSDSLLVLKYTKDINVKILWLADKLSNMRSFYKEKVANGMDFLNHLHQKDPNKQKWYYQEIANNLLELKDTIPYKEYVDLIDKVFGGN